MAASSDPDGQTTRQLIDSETLHTALVRVVVAQCHVENVLDRVDRRLDRIGDQFDEHGGRLRKIDEKLDRIIHLLSR